MEVNADDLMEEARAEAALLLQATDRFTLEVDGRGRARPCREEPNTEG
jgi:hypothetical protein